jgi:hypothetical protein
MTQQERILKLAQEKIGYIGQGGTRQWGKSFKAGFGMAIKFTLENLWISVGEDLPKFATKVANAQMSNPVLIQCGNGAITRARYFKVGGEVPAEGWKCIDAGFGVGGDKVTHWMPIPELPEGGAQ